ncbi:triosephosphate isomerase [Arthrobacter sp. Sa2BUA2]|uniref:Triosephosphate isomerase n=1 Tax=Arthrobacter pullicola TaxID=2762224 RepID=A0ABR8YEN9_9MICC|nr:triose-phosphate isomerase family protein [Arthrobacter pullicola]MBD8042696.1 triosephosphate isomerase [Arthrobacter pullicola]
MTGRTVTVGISTKMYLGYASSKAWLEAVMAVARESEAVSAGTVKLFIAPSFPVLETALGLAGGTPVQIAAQNASEQDSGPLTGEVSPAFLAEMGVSLVELGHAERRELFGEDDAVVAAKSAAAQRNNLQPLLCIGEKSRVAPEEAARLSYAQFASAHVDPDGPTPVVAYEPLWAIGATEPAEPAYVRAVAARLREQLPGNATLLYGGSAGPGLLPLLYPHVDGLFLGRFAHDPGNLALILEEAAVLLAAEERPHARA